MCGICGQVNREPEQSVDRTVLERMNSVLSHRGPDSEGFHIDGNAGLAMRRLAVIDLDTGDQPMSNEDGTVWAVCNGEIYNFQALRKELQAHGHTFRTRSDTEVIVHLYEKHGADCVRHLRGMFALALWDATHRRLFLARDRLGQKPLYYAEHDGAFVFGSELKSILQVPGFERRADLEAIDHYLTLQYVPEPWSAFQGIRKLAPACCLVWENGSFRTESYWSVAYEPKWEAPEHELCEGLRERLKDAVQARLISDVPLGAHLSGGIDSSIIVALMAELSDRPVKTFSIGFDEKKFSELAFARAVAQRYGTEHEEFEVGYGDVPAVTGKLIDHFDEPFADSSALPAYYLADMTRRHVTVALNGDGGDETFAGYQRYSLDRLANLYARLPSWMTQRLVPALLSSLRERVDIPIEENRVAGLKRLAQAASITDKASIVRWGSYFSDEMKELLWADNSGVRRRGMQRSDHLLAACFDRAQAEGFLDRTLFADLSMYLPGDLLVKTDRMTMAHALEGRSPFLDHELVRWAARLPESHKCRGRRLKVLLKRAFADKLPDEILRRGKQGFGIPLGAWFRGPLSGWAQDVIQAPDSMLQTLFRGGELNCLLDEHRSGRTDHGKRLWTLICLDLWFRRYKVQL